MAKASPTSNETDTMSVEDRQAQVKAQREALRAAEDEALGEYDAETLLELERDPLLNALLSGDEDILMALDDYMEDDMDVDDDNDGTGLYDPDADCAFVESGEDDDDIDAEEFYKREPEEMGDRTGRSLEPECRIPETVPLKRSLERECDPAAEQSANGTHSNDISENVLPPPASPPARLSYSAVARGAGRLSDALALPAVDVSPLVTSAAAATARAEEQVEARPPPQTNHQSQPPSPGGRATGGAAAVQQPDTHRAAETSQPRPANAVTIQSSRPSAPSGAAAAVAGGQSEVLSAELLVDVLQQLGVDSEGAVSIDRWRELPPELRWLLLQQIELGQQMSLLQDGPGDMGAAMAALGQMERDSPQPLHRIAGSERGGQAEVHVDDRRRENDGLMYRRPSYAEDLMIYRARLLDEVDGVAHGSPDDGSDGDARYHSGSDHEDTDSSEADDDGSESDGWVPPPPALAALAEEGDLVGLLARLEEGADINASDTSGETALHAAVGASHVDIVRELLRANAAPDSPLNICGWTPLHKAAARGNIVVLRLLLQFGADPSLQKADGTTALALARFNKREHCTALLEALDAAGGPDANTFRPTCLCSLQLLCAVAIRKHHVLKNGVPVDALPLPENLKYFVTGGVPFARFRQEEGVDMEDDEDYASDEDYELLNGRWTCEEIPDVSLDTAELASELATKTPAAGEASGSWGVIVMPARFLIYTTLAAATVAAAAWLFRRWR